MDRFSLHLFREGNAEEVQDRGCDIIDAKAGEMTSAVLTRNPMDEDPVLGMVGIVQARVIVKGMDGAIPHRPDRAPQPGEIREITLELIEDQLGSGTV